MVSSLEYSSGCVLAQGERVLERLDEWLFLSDGRVSSK